MATKQTWALITGASSGIGKAVAFAFGGKGYTLFLTSWDDQPLQQVAVHCHQQFNVDTRASGDDLTRLALVDGVIGALIDPPM